MKAQACSELNMDDPEDAEECARREARIDKRMERMAERKAKRGGGGGCPNKKEKDDLPVPELAQKSAEAIEAMKEAACEELDITIPEDAVECARREARIDSRMERMAERKAARGDGGCPNKKEKDDEAAE